MNQTPTDETVSISESDPAKTDRSGWPELLLFAVLVLAAGVYLFALEEEPYHIDELRQTRAYGASLNWLIHSAFAQDQPPLDPILNSWTQELIGQGDWQQRALPALFAISGLALFGILLRRAGLRKGAPFGVALLATSPLLVSVFVYARPYALPFFLIVAFLLLSDIWLRERRLAAVPILIATALLLPFSRTIEPNLALGAVAAVLIASVLLKKPNEFTGSPWVPIGASGAGLLLVGVPVFLRLQSQLTGYTDTSLLPTLEQLNRLVTDFPKGLTAIIPLWPAAALLIGAVLLLKRMRATLAGIWWFWVTLLIPVTFMLLFLLTTDPNQGLFDRYFFTWIPPLGVVLAVAMDSSVAQWQERPSYALAGVASLSLLAASAVTLATDLTTTERADWEALSNTVEEKTSDEDILILEDLRPLRSYRTPFAGQPRYLSRDRDTPRTLDIIAEPSLIEEDETVALAISGHRLQVKGWEAVPVDKFFTLYLPRNPVVGPVDVASALASFGQHAGDHNGSTLALTSAALYMEAGHVTEACDVLSATVTESGQRSAAQTLLAELNSPLSLVECGITD